MIFINKKQLIILSLGIVSITSVFSCTNRNKQDVLPKVVVDTSCVNKTSFKTDIAPVITAKCCICHDPNGGNYSSPDLTTYSGIFNKKESIANRINLDPSNLSYMPLSGNTPLTACELASINAWISKGAPNN